MGVNQRPEKTTQYSLIRPQQTTKLIRRRWFRVPVS